MFYVLLVVSCILYLLYKYLNSNYDYWEKHHTPFDPPVTFFGNVRDAITFKRSIGEIYTDLYNSHKDDPYVGFYKIRQPALLIREPEIIKNILVKDFNSFAKNDAVVEEDVDPIAAKNPFFQYGQSWRTSRSQLSYCFTSGKMKHMLPLMYDVSKTMVKYIERESKLGSNPFDAKELCSKFTSDNVASCAFGLEGKAFEDPNSEFRSVCKKVLQPSFSLTIKMLVIFLFPNFNKVFSIRFIPEDAANYFRNLVKNAMQYRKENNIVRNDFLDAVLQMKLKPEEGSLTNDDITAHAVSFFGDGFETSSIALSFLLYDMAANVDIQEQLRNEINQVISNHGNTLTYEAIQDMHFLDRALSETLRLHPPAIFMSKVCTNDYMLPSCTNSNDKVKIEQGTTIIIPVYALHRDAKYFPNPETYDPDRFLDSNKSDIVKGAYLPFGDGPRICIGMKFAILQVKIAAVSIIQNFDVRVNKKTKEPLEIDPNFFLLLAKGGLWLDFRKRNQ